ncbi:hypothetical protein [Vagococcus carniphilus]|uniref:Uncharacterized protein n=1 Tax=Vagococcus carniphilus TaxID=218144 RepID=A0A430B6K4_9ENTE|nr:hypothetical protein [Vagococcus carniphilus]QNN72844.1 hypothetical protein H9L18_13480 [Vagococcus carniphilus]RSU15950.1 hypothetical protein CBF28_05840 [Vagococcus carniphilus]
MSQDSEIKKAAQQTFCHLAVNCLNDTIKYFESIKRTKVIHPRDRQPYLEQLKVIEENLLMINNQVRALKLLYREE